MAKKAALTRGDGLTISCPSVGNSNVKPTFYVKGSAMGAVAIVEITYNGGDPEFEQQMTSAEVDANGCWWATFTVMSVPTDASVDAQGHDGEMVPIDVAYDSVAISVVSTGGTACSPCP